jgi:diguanylate cyclase (GGDEF)-like protein
MIMLDQGSSATLPDPNSPLFSASAAQREIEERLRSLGRSEWWLWLAGVSVTVLSIVAFLLLGFPGLFRLPPNFLRVDPDQTVRALLALVLLFNVQMVRRQLQFRKDRRAATRKMAGTSGEEGQADEYVPTMPVDPLTGLYNRSFAESSLAKEIVQARKQNKPLAVLMLAIDDFKSLNQRYSESFGDAVLLEFARRLKRSTRGSDFALRMGGDEFLLVLPECCAKDVKHVLDRVGSLEMDWRGETLSVEYSTAWVDYEPGESPAELIQRAQQLLQLYGNISQEKLSPTSLH